MENLERMTDILESLREDSTSSRNSGDSEHVKVTSPPYKGFEVIEEKKYSGPTSIMYWM
jgi:hypothetical protein